MSPASPDVASPDVSVVMPSYNHQAYVEAAVRSVLDSQGSFELELIVVDDGSSDQSLDLLRSIEDPRLTLIEQENQGAHMAFRRGLDAARADVIFLLNSDDVFAPERLSTLRQTLLQNEETVAATSWLQLVGPEDESLGIKQAWRSMPPWPPARRPDLTRLDDPRAALLTANWISTTSNIAFHRGRLQASPPSFRNLRYCHDWDFFLQLAVQGPVAVVEEPLVSYRVHPDNTLKEGTSQEGTTQEGTTQEGARPRAADSDPSRGKAVMELEILWCLVCHAARLLDVLGLDEEQRAWFWNGLPRFNHGPKAEGVVHRLFALRGFGPEPDDAFLSLLDTESDLRHLFLGELA